jgi:hypothetical protein
MQKLFFLLELNKRSIFHRPKVFSLFCLILDLSLMTFTWSPQLSISTFDRSLFSRRFRRIYELVQKHFYAPTVDWLVLGDFNLRNPSDRNKPGVDVSEMLMLNSAISALCLVELPPFGKQFTWSIKQSTPLLGRLDCFFTWILGPWLTQPRLSNLWSCRPWIMYLVWFLLVPMSLNNTSFVLRITGYDMLSLWT